MNLLLTYLMWVSLHICAYWSYKVQKTGSLQSMVAVTCERKEVKNMNDFLPTPSQYIDQYIKKRFNFDPTEIETNTLFDPEKRFYDQENRIDFFGLTYDIPPFSGLFD